MKLSTPHGHDFFHEQGFFEGPAVYDETGIHRGWLATVGILYLALGLIGLGWLTLMTLASVLFFGALAWVGGIVQFAQSFTAHGWRNVLPAALLGVLYMLAGTVIFYNPVLSSMLLTLILAGSLIGLGMVRIAFSLRHWARRYWTWSVISGVLSMLLGFMMFAQWPVTGLWVIGLFVSLEMIFHGTAALALAIESKAR